MKQKKEREEEPKLESSNQSILYKVYIN